MSDETTPEPVSPRDVVTDAERDAASAAVGPVARWALHRRLYDWVIGFAHHRHATAVLGVMSFAESSFFPIPPDVLLMPLCIGARRKSMWFATVCTVASVLGAIVGYAIGWGAWEMTSEFIFRYVPGFTEERFAHVHTWYDRWGVWVLFAAAFTPIPFKVFTIAGGALGQPLPSFILVAAVGRAARFYLVAAICWWIGPAAVPFIDRYFNLLCIAFVLLLVAGFAVFRLLM